MSDEKPPIGILPYRLWVEQRAEQIAAAIDRYTIAGRNAPSEWLLELQHHLVYCDIDAIERGRAAQDTLHQPRKANQ